jgi:signal peptidase II
MPSKSGFPGGPVGRKWILFIVAVGILVAFDAWTKYWAEAALEPGVTQWAWGGILKLTLSHNKGAAFGLHLGGASRPVFILLSLVVLVWLLMVFHRSPAGSILRSLGVILVSGGAVGNLVDRVFKDRGVVDFLGPYDLRFMVWPIFNVADCYVVIGIALLVLSMRQGRLTTGAVPHPTEAP